jgi:hypothetical protein
MKETSVYDCPVMPLQKIHKREGNITIVEGNTNVPFPIKRLYYLYDIPGGETRGGHAHKNLHQLIVATSGSFDVLLDDGKNKKIVRLNRPDMGLLVVPGIWRELLEFSSGSVCLVLASLEYDEDDYIRDYTHFTQLKAE